MIRNSIMASALAVSLLASATVQAATTTVPTIEHNGVRARTTVAAGGCTVVPLTRAAPTGGTAITSASLGDVKR